MLYLRVTDGAGLPVRDLAPDELQVRIGGRVQTVRRVQPAHPAAIRLLLDVTASVGSEILDGYASLVTALAARADAPSALVFHAKAEPIPDFGGDRAAAIEFFRQLASRPPRPTPLWDILDRALQEGSDSDARQALVVVTDGIDTMSRVRYRQVVDTAMARRIQIHAIQVRPAPPQYPPHLAHLRRHTLPVPDDFKRVSEGTGGSFVELKANAGLVEAVTAALEDLGNQIELEIDATGVRAGRHDVRVRVARPHLTVRAPRTVVLSGDGRR